MDTRSEVYEALFEKQLEEINGFIALLSQLTYVEKVELMGIMIGLKMKAQDGCCLRDVADGKDGPGSRGAM